MNFQFSISNFQKPITQVFVYSFICLLAYLLITPSAHAASCNPIYGGGPTCTDTTIDITKEVLNPSTNFFVHNLGMSDAKYHGNDLVTFQISVTNNSNKALTSITITDNFPKILKFSDGPGTYNATTNTLTFKVDNLAPHASELFTINTHAASQDKFPQDRFCTSNQIMATPSKGAPIQDSSQVCFEKINTTPSTGPEAFGLLALIPTALVGLALKKQASN